MSLIEGVGDEVTVFAVLFLLFILIGSTFYLTNGSISSLSVVPTPFVTVGSEQQNSNEGVEDTEHDQENPQHTCSRNADFSNINNETVLVGSSSDSSGDIDNPVLLKEALPANDIVNEHIHTGSSLYPGVHDTSTPSAPEIPISEERSENVSSQPNQIRVRLKYLDDTDRTVMSTSMEKIGDFKRTHFPEDLANNKIVRLIYNGQLLRDNCTLSFYGIDDNCVVHVHISQARIPQNAPTVSPNADLDLSHLLWPLLSVILGIIWVLYFKYPEFFNIMSVGILFLFTGSFIFFYTMVQHR